VRKNSNPESGLCYPRFLLASYLCSAGTLLGVLSFAATPAIGPNAGAAISKIAPWVLERTANGRKAEFLILLADQADVTGAASFRARTEKGRYVREALWNKARATQRPLLHWLRSHNVEHRSFYIVNMIWVRADWEIALALAARPDVLRVEGNPQIRNVADPAPAERQQLRSDATTAIEPGITDTRAPEVWAMGYTGQGIVVGGADTGYQWDHPALKSHYRGWNGSTANHDYNWHDSIHSSNSGCPGNSVEPCDDSSHGTHTMGTAVGDDGGSNKIGMAPGAKWIGCRNMNENVGTPATYIECMEFFLAPYPVGGTPAHGLSNLAPDVTINSWSCPPSEGCSVNTLKAAVEAQRAAGIMMVVAAGNGGSACSTISDPPGIYDAVYSVGALNTGTDAIAEFSSRGPVTVDGSSRRKPDISAPGTNTRSSTPGNTYFDYSGTSMATPHVAGAVALLWSAQPTLRNDVSLTETILSETAFHIPSPGPGCDPPGVSPNNTYGYGRLDIKTAVDRATTGISNQPNLAPYQPPAWSDKIVVSNVTGTHADNGGFLHTDTLYVDWAVLNGGADINASFTVELYVDGVFRTFWTASPPTNLAGVVSIEDYNLGSLGNGTHTLRIKCDAANSVAESNEGDNEYTKTITIGTNDNFVDRTILTGASGRVVHARNFGATKEAGEPLHAGNVGGASIWYSWTAPFSDVATFYTGPTRNPEDVSFDTLLAVYTGNAVNSLKVIASNDDSRSGEGWSSVTFNATAGVTYQVAIDGKNGETGWVTLAWERFAPLGNISTRGTVETGDNVMIAGFIVTGTQSKSVLVRAIGPSLNVNNVPVAGRLNDPTLQLFDQRTNPPTLIAYNDNWKEGQQIDIKSTGLAPSDDLESAILTTLDPGAYTAILRGVNRTSGIALIEGYDISAGVDSKLANISTRGDVQTGDNVLIGGLIVRGNSPVKVIVRAIGPSMVQAGIANPVQDPTLELHDGNGALLTFDNDWKDSQQAEIQSTGLAPSNDFESAIVATLSPGAYTAIVRGKNNTSGIALVDAYQLGN
jgi:serine protease AprX